MDIGYESCRTGDFEKCPWLKSVNMDGDVARHGKIAVDVVAWSSTAQSLLNTIRDDEQMAAEKAKIAAAQEHLKAAARQEINLKKNTAAVALCNLLVRQPRPADMSKRMDKCKSWIQNQLGVKLAEMPSYTKQLLSEYSKGGSKREAT